MLLFLRDLILLHKRKCSWKEPPTWDSPISFPPVAAASGLPALLHPCSLSFPLHSERAEVSVSAGRVVRMDAAAGSTRGLSTFEGGETSHSEVLASRNSKIGDGTPAWRRHRFPPSRSCLPQGPQNPTLSQGRRLACAGGESRPGRRRRPDFLPAKLSPRPGLWANNGNGSLAPEPVGRPPLFRAGSAWDSSRLNRQAHFQRRPFHRE